MAADPLIMVEDVLDVFKTVLPDVRVTPAIAQAWTQQERGQAIRWANLVHAAVRSRPDCIAKIL